MVAWAKTAQHMDQKRDAPLQTIWIRPHNPPQATEREGAGLSAETYKWLVYPYIGRSFDGNRKWFQLAIELRGGNESVLLPGTNLRLMMDGKEYTLPDMYTYNVGSGTGCGHELFGEFFCVNSWEIAPKTDSDRQALETLVRFISDAHEVYATLIGGPGTNRFSVQLTQPQLAIFRAVVTEYDKPQT